VPALKTALTAAIGRLPKVEGQGGEVNVSRELTNLLNLTDKEAQKLGDQFIASEMFLLALTQDKGETGRLLKQHGGARAALEQAIKAVRGGENVSSAEAEGAREALKNTRLISERAFRQSTRDRARRRNQARDTNTQRRTKNNPVLIGEPVSARPRSSKDWRSVSSTTRCPKRSRASASCRSTWPC
jgi:ATP-dependent Clp protease ATP-binding subunit ClpB